MDCALGVGSGNKVKKLISKIKTMRLNNNLLPATLSNTFQGIAVFMACFVGLCTTNAQNLTQEWSKKYPNAGEKAFNGIIEATNGYLVAVGEHKSDGLLRITDHSTGQLVTEKSIGYGKDDAFRAVVQTYDGHFLLAGTTASLGQGNTDVWLVEVDERGQKIREAVFGTTGRDNH